MKSNSIHKHGDRRLQGLSLTVSALPVVRSRVVHIGAGIDVTDYADYEAILAVIEQGVDVAHRNPKPGEPVAADDYIAWCVLNALRRSGWSVVRTSN